MKKTIEINGKPMEFEATATTDHMVEGLFGIRVTYALNNTSEDEYPDLVKKIAFVMNRRAVLGSWKKVLELSQEDFYNWLDEIDAFALENGDTAKEILTLYAGNRMTHVAPKNATSPQAGS